MKNRMSATTAAIVCALALTTCTSAAPAAEPKASPGPPQIGSSAIGPNPADYTNIYRAVHAGWVGDDAPDKPWIDDAATLVCKQIIGGIAPRVVPNHHHNNEVVVAAAEHFVCEIDR